jgi:hypothetical protein
MILMESVIWAGVKRMRYVYIPQMRFLTSLWRIFGVGEV